MRTGAASEASAIALFESEARRRAAMDPPCISSSWYEQTPEVRKVWRFLADEMLLERTAQGFEDGPTERADSLEHLPDVSRRN